MAVLSIFCYNYALSGEDKKREVMFEDSEVEMRDKFRP
jgi:hypothetical protein